MKNRIKWCHYCILAGILSFNCSSVWAEPLFSIWSDSLVSGTFTNEFVADGFGCHGDNQSPALQWRSPPAETKSFVIMMYDPDAPTGSGWWHWVVANIPPNINHLAQGIGNQPKQLPNGAVAIRNDFGHNQYGGPCPPEGSHRYQFIIYALDIEHIDISEYTTAAYIGFVANRHALATALVTYRYQR